MLFEEIDGLEKRGVDTSLLKVSASAHVIASYNKTLDKVTERFLGSRRLGTTGRGIGPTYADKMNRIGIRIQDLFDDKILRAKVEGVLELKGQLLPRSTTAGPRPSTRSSTSSRRTPTGSRRTSSTAGCCSTRPSTAARPCCSRPARRRCSTSTTAPTRS